MRSAAVIGLVLLAACGEDPNQKTVEIPVQSIPAEPRADCPDSRARLYAECRDQREILAEALALAETQGKTVLVEFGAEWCVWCHVLDRHLKGETFLLFDYDYDGETYTQKEPEAEADQQAAKALGNYMADNFILVHIDAEDAFGRQPESGRGWDVIETAGAAPHFRDWLPYVFAVDLTGEFAAEFDTRAAEKREEDSGYRGYDRAALLRIAQAVRAKARGGPAE